VSVSLGCDICEHLIVEPKGEYDINVFCGFEWKCQCAKDRRFKAWGKWCPHRTDIAERLERKMGRFPVDLKKKWGIP